MLAVNPRDRVPDSDAQEPDRAQHQAEHQPGGDFATNDSPPVSERDFAQGHRANDERRGL